ncbi:MAG: hypothetical protein ACK5PW_04480 [Burkholderiales bacterium]
MLRTVATEDTFVRAARDDLARVERIARKQPLGEKASVALGRGR